MSLVSVSQPAQQCGARGRMLSWLSRRVVKLQTPKLLASRELLHLNVFYVLCELLMLLKRERHECKDEEKTGPSNVYIPSFRRRRGVWDCWVSYVYRWTQARNPRRTGDSDSLEASERSESAAGRRRRYLFTWVRTSLNVTVYKTKKKPGGRNPQMTDEIT